MASLSAVLGLAITVGIIVVLERRSRAALSTRDWATPKSKGEAAAILLSLVSFYALILILPAIPTKPASDGGIPEAESPYGAIAAIWALANWLAIVIISARIGLRSPQRQRPDVRVGAFENFFRNVRAVGDGFFNTYLPTRLGDAGEVLGIPRLFVWLVLGALLVAAIVGIERG